jgi:hypothetical protein
VTADAVIAALNLPAGARVDQRVPKKLLLENGAPTAGDKRLINEGIEEVRWLAALKPATCGVPEFRDEAREYLEIAVLHMALRPRAKRGRLAELVHRAVPYPVLLLISDGDSVSASLAHKRHALNDANKLVLDGEPPVAEIRPADSGREAAFLQAMDMARQPKATLYALYQGWMDVLTALESSYITGTFAILDSDVRARRRREALREVYGIDAQIRALRSAAGKASQMAKQVELNLQLQQLNRQREQALQYLQGNP